MSIYDDLAPEDILRIEQESQELDPKRIKTQWLDIIGDELGEWDSLELGRLYAWLGTIRELLARVGFPK